MFDVGVARTGRPAPRDLVRQWPGAPQSFLTPAERTAVGAAAAVAINVRALRQAAGLSQQSLADASGVGVRTIRKVEAGEVWPDIATVAWLAHALGRTPGALISNSDVADSGPASDT